MSLIVHKESLHMSAPPEAALSCWYMKPTYSYLTEKLKRGNAMRVAFLHLRLET
jgi:hypothetical protein